MLIGDYQVVDVLLLVGNVAPVALYFLALGLVNSHSRPYLISRRADFVALTSVLVPILLWPVPGFVHSGYWWVLLIAAGLAAATFAWMLPKTDDGFVIYNITESRCMRLLDDALTATGLSGSWESKTWRSDCGTMAIHVRGFALLRNVTLHIEKTGPRAARLYPTLAAQLQHRLSNVAQLPSTMGAGLVLVGLALMILPMWTVSRHIDDLVDAMSHLFG
ncbi:MAG TPA: hypothetical protein VMV94_04235 [Phycisphaerae bacterium]|nr:hypothetical protein [Phycisphaerae bacterium]